MSTRRFIAAQSLETIDSMLKLPAELADALSPCDVIEQINEVRRRFAQLEPNFARRLDPLVTVQSSIDDVRIAARNLIPQCIADRITSCVENASQELIAYESALRALKNKLAELRNRPSREKVVQAIDDSFDNLRVVFQVIARTREGLTTKALTGAGARKNLNSAMQVLTQSIINKMKFLSNAELWNDPAQYELWLGNADEAEVIGLANDTHCARI